MGVITGIRGLVNGVSRFQNFSVSATADLKEIMDAGTQGGRRRIPGTAGWDGTYVSGGVEPDVGQIAGDIIAFDGSIDGLVGLQGSALITQTVITISVSSNDPITFENTLYGLDDITAGPSVVDEPDPPLAPDFPKGICVELAPITSDDPTSAYVSEENTSNIVITLTVDAAEYVDCSTNGARGAIDGAFDASVAYDRNVDDFADLPERGEPFYCRIPTEENSIATKWYTFEYMRVGAHDNMQVNKNGDLVSASVPLAHSMNELIGTTAPVEGVGKIVLPSGVTWRPEPAPVAFAKRILKVARTVDMLTDMQAVEPLPSTERRLEYEQSKLDGLYAAIDGYNARNLGSPIVLPTTENVPEPTE